MKKLCVLLCATIFLATLAGCDKDTSTFFETTSLAESYIERASEHCSNKNYDEAIRILEEGYDVTSDPEVLAFLEDVRAAVATAPAEETEDTQYHDQTTAPTEMATEPVETTAPQVQQTESPEADYSRYNGNWGDAGQLRIHAEGDWITVELTSKQGSWDRLAVIYETVPLSQMKDGALWIPYVDSWGNSGVLTVAFFGNRIIYNVLDVVRNPSALWCVEEGAFTVYRKDGGGIGTSADTAAEGVLAEFNSDQRMLVNIFLSNFSEQNFAGYPSSDFAIIKYAIMHCKINIPTYIIEQNGMVKISSTNADKLTKLYFGKTAQVNNGDTLVSADGLESITYIGGFYEYRMAAMPDTSYLTIATYMADNGDGTYSVNFNVYHLNDAQYGYSIYPYYGLSDGEAKIRSELNLAYSGSAVIKNSTNTDGTPFYQLISYSK